ncbi:trimeric intracellular cation channel family protein [Nitratifractor sp.]
MLLLIAEYLGIAAFSASGFYIAVRHRLDLLGIYLSAFLTALGGGILRDLLSDRAPYSLTHSLPSAVVVAVTTILIWRRMQDHPWESKLLFVFVDALGMVSFAVSGALVGLETGFNLAGVVLLAFTTAVGGGILRDVLLNRIPYLLHGGFYGVIAVLVGALLYFLHSLQAPRTLGVTLVFLFAVTLRMIAYLRRWHLPVL